MTNNKKIIEECIFKAIDSFNETSNKIHLKKSGSQKIMSEDSNLDSLDIINFITACEKNLSENYNSMINLLNEDTLNPLSNNLESIENIVMYIRDNY